MANLILIRHGQASFGAENYDQLSELGQRQARAVGRQLQRSGILPAGVYSGNMQRQKHTAKLASDEASFSVPLVSKAEFDEYDSKGVFANYLPKVLDQFPHIRDQMTPDDYSILKDREMFRTLFFPVMQQWINGDPVSRAPVEPWVEFRDRVIDGLTHVRESLQPDQTAVVFTSGGVISVAMAHALNLDWERSVEFNWRTANGSITRFSVTKRGYALDGYNHHGHMEFADQDLKVTYL